MTEEFRELTPEMLIGLHSLKHGGFVSVSMAKGLAHFGYARLAGGTEAKPEYAITQKGRDYLDRVGACKEGQQP
ncbi:hypothetical protein ACWC9Q_18410 [Streptomyces sp. NPDC001142]